MKAQEESPESLYNTIKTLLLVFFREEWKQNVGRDIETSIAAYEKKCPDPSERSAVKLVHAIRASKHKFIRDQIILQPDMFNVELKRSMDHDSIALWRLRLPCIETAMSEQYSQVLKPVNKVATAVGQKYVSISTFKF